MNVLCFSIDEDMIANTFNIWKLTQFICPVGYEVWQSVKLVTVEVIFLPDIHLLVLRTCNVFSVDRDKGVRGTTCKKSKNKN